MATTFVSDASDCNANDSVTWTIWTDSSTNDTWTVWQTTGTIASTSGSYGSGYRSETAQERAGRRRAEQESQKKRKAATKAARELLRECLSPEQRLEHEERNRFHLVSSDGNRYRINCSRNQENVQKLSPAGKRIEVLCANACEVPLCDNALAQKLMLETDEQAFRRVANIRAIA